MKKRERVHFIGIAGSAIAPLAVMMAQKGYKVTGSEHNKVWEPAKSLLQNNKIEYTELEYNPENVEKADLIIIGGSALLKIPDHPEYLAAKKLNKKIKSYAYIVRNFITKEDSIVITGSYGKSTTTSILIWIYETAGLNPSYMVGGKPIGLDKGVKSTDGKVSIVEGDEFAAAWGFDMEPRFIHYNPTHAIITSAAWDHLDLYPTEESYINAFNKLTTIVKDNDGLLLVNAKGENIEKVLSDYKGKLPSYSVDNRNSLNTKPFYSIDDIKYTEKLTSFNFLKDGEILAQLETKQYGKHNIENILAAASMAYEHGVPIDQIKKAIKTFKGLKRRLENYGTLKTGAKVIDDFAHSPFKAEAALKAVKERFPEKKVIGIYEPRPSIHQTQDILPLYKGVFDAADLIFITKLSQKADTKPEDRIRGKDMLEVIKKTQPNARYIVKNRLIAEYLNNETDEECIILFMGGTGWNDLLPHLYFKEK